MNRTTKTAVNIFGIYLGAGFLAYILAPLGGMLHRLFWKSHGCWFWGPCDAGVHFEGFIYLFIYLLAVFSFSALSRKIAWKVYIAGTFLFWIYFFYIYIIEDLNFLKREYFGSLTIMFCALALGYLSAWGIKALIKKINKKGEEKTE